MLLENKKTKTVRKNESDVSFKKVAVVSDKKIVKDKKITDNETTNQQLMGNLLFRSITAGFGSYTTISRKNFMGSALALATLSMWLTEDLSQIWQRQNNINNKTYKQEDYKGLKFKDIKSSDDVAHYIHDKQYKIARNFLTRDAIESIIEFISFDLLPDQIIYQQYQQSHPSSAYKDTKDFLKRECKTLVGSMGIGVLAYPVLNLFDKIIPETGRLLSRPFLKAHSTNDKNA